MFHASKWILVCFNPHVFLPWVGYEVWLNNEYKICLWSMAADFPGFNFANQPLKRESRVMQKKSFEMRHSSQTFFVFNWTQLFHYLIALNFLFSTRMKKNPSWILWSFNMLGLSCAVFFCVESRRDFAAGRIKQIGSKKLWL